MKRNEIKLTFSLFNVVAASSREAVTDEVEVPKTEKNKRIKEQKISNAKLFFVCLFDVSVVEIVFQIIYFLQLKLRAERKVPILC
jgi:hypothetical protein